MTESLPTIASVVIVPDETIDYQQSPSSPAPRHSPSSQSPSRSLAKRGPSQISENESKRPRLSDAATDGQRENVDDEKRGAVGDGSGTGYDSLDKSGSSSRNVTTDEGHVSATTANAEASNISNVDAVPAVATSPANPITENSANGITDESRQTAKAEQQRRRSNGQVEERKRSRRLFGALIGTLSQSSTKTTAAQRKRADVEQKQQAKLKMQAEELDQERLKRLEAVMRVRRREQRKFDEQSMRIRHSNQLAMANFLHTITEPRLYYKPWDLTQEEDERVRKQIEDAEALVTREEEEFHRKVTVEQHQEEEDSPMNGIENNRPEGGKSPEGSRNDPKDENGGNNPAPARPEKEKEADDERQIDDKDTAMMDVDEGGDKHRNGHGQYNHKDGKKKNGREGDGSGTADGDEDADECEEKTIEEDKHGKGKGNDVAKADDEGKQKVRVRDTEVDREVDREVEAPKDNGDDVGDEVLEAGEDTVIY